MSNAFELTVGRVVVHGEAVKRPQADQLRHLIEDELQSLLLAGPLPEPESTNLVRIDVAPLGLEGPEGARRLARDVARATLRALRGENDG